MHGYFTVNANAAPLPPLQGLVRESGAAVIRGSYGTLMYVVPGEQAEVFEYALSALTGPDGYIRGAEPMFGFESGARPFTDEFLALSVL